MTHRKALSMPMEIIIAVVVLIVVALAVILFTTDNTNKGITHEVFRNKCGGFCESRNLTFVSDEWNAYWCNCADRSDNLVRYVYYPDGDVFVKDK